MFVSVADQIETERILGILMSDEALKYIADLGGTPQLYLEDFQGTREALLDLEGSIENDDWGLNEENKKGVLSLIKCVKDALTDDLHLAGVVL
jgi:hypothetical protein